MLTSEQIRAGRALLRLEQAELASAAGVSIETVRRFEAVDGKVKGRADTIQAVKSALENFGVVLIDDDGSQGVGVRLDERHTEVNKQLSKFMETVPTDELEKRLREILKEKQRREIEAYNEKIEKEQSGEQKKSNRLARIK